MSTKKTDRNLSKNILAHGFTIVELIVVIVVIGVLAGITLASYGYLTHRADDTATTANVKQYVDALEMYAFEKGHYPAGNGICIGAEPADSYGGCGKYESVGTGCEALDAEPESITADWSESFNNALLEYMGAPPNDVQSSPYRTLVLALEDCNIYMTASSPTYKSGSAVTYSDKYIITTSPGAAGKAYTISYSVDKDGECPIANSVLQKDWLLGSDSTSCAVYGGNAVPAD